MRWFFTLSPLLIGAGCGVHPTPTAALAIGTSVETATYPAGRETLRGLLCRPTGEGPFAAVVIVHGDFGVTDWVKEMARRLAGEGYLTLAVDLYRGQAVTDLLDAHIMDRGLSEDRVRADLRAAVDYLAGRPDVRSGSIGILGWDTGGGYALDAALGDARLRAVVTCCGRLTTDPALLAPLNASVLGVFAGQDEGISPQTIAQFRAAMHRAGKRLAGIHVYPACGHGFMDPSSPQTTALPADEARGDAWTKIQNYLATELKFPDKETRRQGDKETERMRERTVLGTRQPPFTLSLCLPMSLSPCLLVSLSGNTLNRCRRSRAASAVPHRVPAHRSGAPSSNPLVPG